MGLFFNKEEKPQELRDPFDDRLVIDLPTGSATLGYCRNAIKVQVQEVLTLLNEIKENPKFKKADELLNKNIAVIEEQNNLILKNKELIEKQNQQIAVNIIKITTNEGKNKEIAEKQTLCMTELNKKTEEIKKILTTEIFESIKKEHQERFLNNMEDYKKKLLEDAGNYFEKAVNDKWEELVNKMYGMANQRLNETILKIGLEIEKTCEWCEAQINEPLVFIDVLINEIKSNEKDTKKLEVMKKHLKEIIDKDEYSKELSDAISTLNSYIDMGKSKGDTYEKNCLVALRNLQMSLEGYYSAQREKEKAKEEKKKARETKREKPKTKSEDDDDDEDLGDAEIIEKKTEESEEEQQDSSDVLDDFKIRI